MNSTGATAFGFSFDTTCEAPIGRYLAKRASAMIEARELTKRFVQPVREPGLRGALRHLIAPRQREITAVDRVSFTIEAGETVACVGPNGAGKSTTIKMLTGVLRPTQGSVRVAGLVPWQHRIQNNRNIGVVFGQRTQLWWDIPIRDSFDLLRDIYEVPPPVFERRLDELVELLELGPFVGVTARRVSLGQRMRAELAASLLHGPQVLFLDEPTIGLDHEVKARVRSFIRQLNERFQVTVLLTSHDLDDIQGICKRLIIVDDGRVVYDGGLQAARDLYARERLIHFVLNEPWSGHADAFAHVPQVRIRAGSASDLSIGFDRSTMSVAQVAEIVLRHADVADFRVDEPGIDAVLARVYAAKQGAEDAGGP